MESCNLALDLVQFLEDLKSCSKKQGRNHRWWTFIASLQRVQRNKTQNCYLCTQNWSSWPVFSLSHWCANRWVVIHATTSASMMSLYGWLVDSSPSVAIWGLRWIGSENCGTFISRARYGFYPCSFFRTQRLWRRQHAVILHTESHIAGKNRTRQRAKVSEVIVLQVQGLKSCSFHVAYKVLQCNPSIPNWKKTCKWT
jgi:hypothetical protein